MRTIPDAEAVRRLPSPHAAEVTEDFIDYNGHMNITHYLRLGAEGVEAALMPLGINETHRRERGLTMFSVEHHLNYFSEVHLGSRITVHPQLLARSARTLHVVMYLLDATKDRLANTVEVLLAHVDMTTRRAVPFTPEIAAALDAEIARHTAALEPFVSGSMGIRAASGG